jgi:hypothetical protein
VCENAASPLASGGSRRSQGRRAGVPRDAAAERLREPLRGIIATFAGIANLVGAPLVHELAAQAIVAIAASDDPLVAKARAVLARPGPK